MSVLVLAEPGVIGVEAFWLLIAWLLSAIVSQFLSDAKGYGEKPGLASGLLLPVAAPLVWLLWRGRAGGRWNAAGGWRPVPSTLFPRLARWRRERDTPAG